jgi:hypothetical protein
MREQKPTDVLEVLEKSEVDDKLQKRGNEAGDKLPKRKAK